MKKSAASDVRMRKADSAKEDFHLLEELSKPMACLNAGKITLWVYRTGPLIREIVLAGHAESRTCSAATSAIIEAAKRLGESAEWMLTCGAAFFRIKPGMDGNQLVLIEMMRALSELAEETGLVQIIQRDWNDLQTFRQRYRKQSASAQPQIILPNAEQSPVADYVPIIPSRSADGQPLIFQLEGWDFDCPAFQSVADRHLRKVRRELLRDALRRRARYRFWLKNWTERWARDIKRLRKPEAGQIRVDVPGPADESKPMSQPMEVDVFFEKRLKEFLHPSQTWHKGVAYLYCKIPFAETESSDLDEKIRPSMVNMIDFERGIATERLATAADEYTPRERIMRSDPGLISTCLRYIRRMDAIISPYEDLRLWQRIARAGTPETGKRKPGEREAACVGEVSMRIVMETMIRGWPSFYLDDADDQAIFEDWAKEYRPRIWSIMARQAEAAGVALELLHEDNVIYDVRFDGNLGCSVQPLMLVDNVSHVQVHGSRAGASAVVPLWPHRINQASPAAILFKGLSNRERAAAIVNQARSLTLGSGANPEQAARLLRLAMECHPGEAGKLILAEWASRLGRDTAEEYRTASEIIYARELCAHLRYTEAMPHLAAYLRDEPQPARNAMAMNALCEVMARAENAVPNSRAEVVLSMMKKTRSRYKTLQERLGNEAGKDFGTLTQEEFQSLIQSKPHVPVMLRELEALVSQIKELGPRVEESGNQCCQCIAKALKSPAAVRKQYPALALAAKEAPEQLRRVLDCQGRFVPPDAEMSRRYDDIDKVVEMRALFKLLHRLGSIHHRLGPNDGPARAEAMEDLRKLAAEPWLPEPSECSLSDLVEEFRKGEWDHLLANQIGYLLQESMSVCYTRIQDLLSDLMSNVVPLAEPLATKIHIAQTIDGKYAKALEMMFRARVGFGRALQQRWTVLDSDVREMPPDGKLEFNPQKRVISLIRSGKTTPLLQSPHFADGEADYVANILADPLIPQRINRFAASLAGGILAMEVEPQPSWHLWRDAMEMCSKELLFTVALFGCEASPMPEFAPAKEKQATEMEERLNLQTPLNAPQLDLQWKDMGKWEMFVGPNPVRSIDSPI